MHHLSFGNYEGQILITLLNEILEGTQTLLEMVAVEPI